MKPPEVSPMERWVLDRICRPLLAHIPESVTPNSLSWAGHLAAWAAFILASSSVFVSRELGVWALCFAGLAVWAQMILDNLDGMHARATGQCSKFGEFLDHWLDALNIPLTAAGIAMAIGVGPALLVGVLLTATLVYNSQLVTYRTFGRFVPPPTSGTVAQFYLGLSFLALGPYFYFFPRELGFNQQIILVMTLASIWMSLRQCYYYWTHLKRAILEQVPFLVLASLFGALHFWGLISGTEYVLLASFLSFRITGSCVLNTVLQQAQYHRMDYGVLLSQALIYFAATRTPELAMGGLLAPQLAVYGALIYIFVRNVLELARLYPEFSARVAEAPARIPVE